MNLESVPLARQVDFVFRQLEEELTDSASGTILIHVRNNAVGKYGVRHHPIETKNGKFEQSSQGMTKEQVQAFRQMAIDALKMRKNWSHGEIMYDFSVRSNSGSWSASVLYESNYNTSNWNARFQPKHHMLWDSQK